MKPNMETVPLSVGETLVYHFDSMKLHAYNTKDPISGVCYVLETPRELIGIELPPFHNNLAEFSKYIKNLSKPLAGIIISAHPSGGDYFRGTRIYAAKATAKASGEGGQINGIIEHFAEIFEDAFDTNIAAATDEMVPGQNVIGGVAFTAADKSDGSINIEIPAIKAVYMHMLGDKTHNIFSNVSVIDDMSADLRDFRSKGYSLYLTSHDVPRSEESIIEKQWYLEETKKIIAASKNGGEFTAKMKAAFPDYHGVQYLEMSAGMLFAG